MKDLYSAFRKPAANMSSKPLFFWNTPLDKMTEEGLREIVRRCYTESGYSGFGILPFWQEGYLSERYFSLYEAALEEGSKYGMQFSLYDENGFPSYTAGGLFAEKYPALTAKRLDMIESSVVENGKVFLKLPQGHLMGAVAYNTITHETIDITEKVSFRDSSVEYPIAGAGWKLMAFLCVKDGAPGMDYLSEEAVAGFIQITYEEYYKRFKKYFDNGTITSAFYDEPSFWGSGDALTAWGVAGARMWTDDFNEAFSEMFGKDINPVLYYPALWYDIGEKTAEARDKLHAVRTELFAKRYIGQLNAWCQEHGIELMGHMLLEDQDNPVPFHGDLMYCFKYQACPSVDVIVHYGMTEDYYKIISSAAYNWDHSHVGVECYGAIDDMPVNVLYKAAMDLYAKGINVMVPHAVWYDAKDYWFRPELSYRTEPYASELFRYNQYIARLQTMLREGRHVADIAVLYPIDTLEYDYNFNKNNDLVSGYTNYIALTKQLSERIRLDYTYIHPSVLDEAVTVDGATLHLNNQNNYEDYKVMIIPSIRVISKTNLEKINAFYQNGGIVISVGDLPRMGTAEADNAAVQSLIQEMFGEAWDTAQTKSIARTNGNGGKIYHLTNLDSFETILKQAYDNYDVTISSVSESNGHLTYIHKVLSGLNVYFFANSSEIAVNPAITLRGEFENLEVWNPVTGERHPIAATVSNGKTTFDLGIDSISSLFVVAGETGNY